MTRKTLLSALTLTLLAAAPVAGFAADSDMNRQDVRDEIRQDASDIRQDAREKGQAISDKAREMKNEVRRDARDARDNVRQEVRDMKNDVRSSTSYPTSDMSDAAVNQRVERAIDSYRNVNANTQNGVVILNGTVRTDSEKSDIVKRARDVDGVRSVKDEMTVSSSGSQGVGGYIDDASITTVVKGKFLGQSGLDSMDISVETVNGVVTLTGKVDNQAQIGLAEGVAKEADGVKRVVNHLTYQN